jgi:hypothetical protein
MRDRAVQMLQSSAAPRWLAVLGFVMSLPVLGAGLQADDHVLAFGTHHSPHPFSLFSADATELARLRELGCTRCTPAPRS